jgi:GNAT superfamily N-acetyltransferase
VGADLAIVAVGPGEPLFDTALACARMLEQEKYLTRAYPFAEEVIVLLARERAQGQRRAEAHRAGIGFLLLLVQVIGREEGRPPIETPKGPLTEGYVNAFGVVLTHRREGTGQRLQEAAIEQSQRRGCHQMRSRSPITATENYALKLKMGYVAHPSDENDSYFFLKKLAPSPQ